MENQDFLQLSTVNSSLPILGQQQGSLSPGDLLQPHDVSLEHSGSFSDQMKAGIADIAIKVVEYDQYLLESVLGKSSFELVASKTNSELPKNSDNFDPLTGGITSVNGESVLDLTVTATIKQLELFANDTEFIDKMNLAFGDDIHPQAADALIQDLTSGEAMPKVEILADAHLKANGPFGEGTIYLSEQFLSENVTNPKVVASALLEEVGHYVDQELSSINSPGDEGDISARLVRDETIPEAKLEVLEAEDDIGTIFLNGDEIPVELAGEDYNALVPTPLDSEINEGLLTPGAEPPDTPPDPPSIAPPYPDHLLKYEPGSPLTYDENVKQWQQRMHDLGKPIVVDGLYGPQSEQVAREFQQEKGLTVDGIVGPETWGATFATPPVDPGTGEPTDINQAGLLLVEEFEGYAEQLGDGTDRVRAYRDPGGVLTIGFGHTGPGVTEGLIITRAEAEQLLRGDLDKAEAPVSDRVTVPLNENQFSALVSFVFNVGAGNFEESTLLERLNQSDYQGAADEFHRWNMDNGEVLPGLIKRREAERELFLALPVA